MELAMPSITYQRTDETGLEFIRQLWEQLNEHHRSRTRYFRTYYEKLAFDDRKRYFEAIVREGGVVAVDIVRDPATGRPVGYSVSSLSNDEVGEIESLFVDPAYRLQGIGSMLVSRAIAWLEKCGVEKIQVKVAQGNEDTWKFYNQFGFYPRMTVLERKFP
jgi:ribosomal protein S18 acetylase RimI-like enzyme